jgi:branched-chain amino acid transport system substrate-binding protein
MRRSTKFIAVVAVLALAAVACSSKSPSAGTKKTVKIAFLGALTGDYAQLEIHASQGAALAIEQANARGDLPVTVQYLAEDTQGSKDKATPIANQLKDDTSLVAVIGPGFSGESFAVNPIFGQAGIPEVDHSATNPGLNAIANVSGKTWWRTVGNDFDQGGPAPDIMFKYLKAKKVFIAHDKTAYGEGLATIVRNGVNSKYPGKVAGFEGVDPGKKDYSSLVSKIIISGADFFYWGGYSPESSLIMKQLREKGSKVQFVGADGSKDTTFLSAKAAVEGSYLTCPCTDPNISTDPADVTFVADYKAKYNVKPGIYGGEGFDAANIIMAAIKKAGAPGSDIAAYRATLATNIGATSGFKGLTKTYAFQPNGELVPSAAVIFLYKVENDDYKTIGNVADLIK